MIILLLFGLIFFLMFGAPIIFFIVGATKRKQNKHTAKVFFILGVAWLIIAGGICASIVL